MTTINYDAPPTVARFMRSEMPFRLIAGPVGSGKTTGCIFEFLRRACEQTPAPDGLRHTRFAIVRQTLKQLKETVLKDILFFLNGLATYKVSDTKVEIEFGDVRSEWLLIPLDDPEDQRRLLSSQLTGAWMSECIEIDIGLVPALQGRCGRFPSALQGGCTWFGVIADTNFPSEGSPWHRAMEIEVPSDWEIFKQPGGLEPDAENLCWLTQTPQTLALPPDHPERLAQGRTYYERLARTPNEDWVRRYVHAQYGNDPSGSAVFGSSFKRSFHVTMEELFPVPGYPLIIAQDFGRNPCSLIAQIDHRGRLLVLEEVLGIDIGLENHLKTNLRPRFAQTKYLGFAIYLIGDPSGKARSSHYEETSFDLCQRAGFNSYPAPTNNLDKRLRAVEAMLLSQSDGGPRLLIDGNRCPSLVLAMNGSYRYAAKSNGQLAPTPEKKHPWSDLADDLQYLSLVAHGEATGYYARRMGLGETSSASPPPSPIGWT